MKTIVIPLLSLLISAGVGWYFGYTSPAIEANRVAMQTLRSLQHDDRETAVFGIAAIRLIDSGENQKALQLLAQPIGIYYRVYGLHAETNKERIDMRDTIEKLASTDQVVAAEIQKKE